MFIKNTIFLHFHSIVENKRNIQFQFVQIIFFTSIYNETKRNFHEYEENMDDFITYLFVCVFFCAEYSNSRSSCSSNAFFQFGQIERIVGELGRNPRQAPFQIGQEEFQRLRPLFFGIELDLN